MTTAMQPATTVSLVCPACRGPLDDDGTARVCATCGERYPNRDDGRPDLRLRRPRQVTTTVALGPQRTLGDYDRSLFEAKSPPNTVAMAALDDPRWTMGSRLTPRIMSHFPVADRPDAVLLDVGCGDGAFEPLATRLGYAYLGVDVSDPGAPAFADSRALPYPDGCVDVVLSIGVLEHVEHPDLAVAEAWRVLRPGGRIVGGVAFGEPFHDNSFFHHSVLGAASVLERNGFEIELLSPHETWDVVRAQTLMSLLHGMPGGLARFIASPLRLTHRAWWKAAHLARRDDDTSELSRRIRSCGGVGFVARKPD